MNTEEYPHGLTAKENQELIKSYQLSHDENLKQQLILGNMRLVSHFIKTRCTSFYDCVCPGYPTYEDLNQMGIFVIIKCIEKFDPDRGYSFSSYLTHALRLSFLMMIRQHKGKAELHYDDAITGSDNLIFLDKIEDESANQKHFLDEVEASYIKHNILPYLHFDEQLCAQLFYFEDKNHRQISEIMHISRSYATRMVLEMNQKISQFYERGVDEISKELRGVKLGNWQLQKFKEAKGFIKKHGEDFLRDEFLPTLSKNDEIAFRSHILYYAGQNASELALDSGHDFKLDARDIERKIESLPREARPNPNREKIKLVKAFILKNGGAPFLAKYFLPTLGLEERRAFNYGLLQFGGVIDEHTANLAGLSLPELKKSLKSSLEKLKQTDFRQMVLKDIMHEQ